MESIMRILTVTLLTSALTLSATQADDKPKSILQKLNPLSRLKKDEPEKKTKSLTETLRTDPDEKKRKAAAVELRDADAKEAGEIIPILIASLKQDPSPAVRSAAAESIAKFKPVNSAGAVLEAAAVNDPSDAVRTAAQGSLQAYQQAGYRLTSLTVTQTAEPPLAPPRPRTGALPQTKQIMAPPTPKAAPPVSIPAGINRGPNFTQTAEPPLANSKSLTDPPLKSAIESPPVIRMPTPLPMPAAPKSPSPIPIVPKPLPAGPIPTPPPSNDPGFEF